MRLNQLQRRAEMVAQAVAVPLRAVRAALRPVDKATRVARRLACHHRLRAQVAAVLARLAHQLTPALAATALHRPSPGHP